MSAKEQILDALDNSRESLLLAVEPLSDNALQERLAVGQWSVADVLINITAWEAELVTGLMRLRQNKRPDRLLATLKDPKTYDRLRFEENQNRDLDQIFMDLQQSRVQVEEWLLEFSERDLTNPRRYHWLKGKALDDLIARTSYNRENQIVPRLETFTEQWLARESDAPMGAIPLGPVDLNNKRNTNEDTD